MASATRRSDEIRRRRKDRSHTVTRRKKAGRKKNTLVTHGPPVMSRSPMVDVTRKKKKRKVSVRRRYDVPLNAQGAEMRLPALPKVRLGWRLLSAMVVGFFAFILYQLWYSPSYQVQAAEIVGLQKISVSEVNDRLNVSEKQIFEIEGAHIQENLLTAFPEFSDVSVSVSFPQSVVITVTERVPVLLWKNNNKMQLIDANGWGFHLRDESMSAGLPVIEALDDPPPLPPSILPVAAEEDAENQPEGTVEKVSPLPETKDAYPILTQNMVSALLFLVENAPEGAVVTYSEKHGLGWHDARDWDVYFGRPDDLGIKLSVYHAILEYLKSQNTPPEMISVEFVRAPYFRLKP